MKPILLFHGTPTNSIYATRNYRERGGVMVSADGAKSDVTNAACIAVLAHLTQPCARADCACGKFREHMTVTEVHGK
jgi:hypothetical protein